ncbi:hypothetical protein Afer_0204 [Acidimicrobium ferrooxidans DSM 10331]|uniref:Uncharacterized protein n=1 Tax=Acidimicrobium ferrooxidans (strain DSM 10331 / JCM 15462 / NBRC 103882 / ICP) TaxID=525909 RepID=C7M275_ACIFD|nr:hypothetical protein [Acidimicrobium ferrooxidans]ACU53173.1 hypothetical protein Afer_0204 [Acidimicrobium ferrooxidans DSM 10331]
MSGVELGTPALGSRVFGVPVAKALAWGAVAVVVAAAAARIGGILGVVVAAVVATGVAGAASIAGWHPLWWVVVAVRERARRATERVGQPRRAVRFDPDAGSVRIARLVARHAGVLGRGHDGSLDDAWGELLRVLGTSLRGRERFLVRSDVIPAIEREQFALEPDDRWLAERTWMVETHLGVASDERRGRGRRVRLVRALEAAEAAARGQLALEPISSPSAVAWSVLPRTGDRPDAVLERTDALEIDGGFVRALHAARFPVGAVHAWQLAGLFAPAGPRRVVTLVAQPLDPRSALRQLGRHRVETAADQELRRRHGYRLGIGELGRSDRLDEIERELANGHALCRWELFVVVAAPTLAELAAETTAAIERAAACSVDLATVLGRQREAVELALLGVSGWT